MLPERQDISTELCRMVRAEIGEVKANRWFGAQTDLSIDGDRVSVRASTSFLLKFLQQRYASLITECARKLTEAAVTIEWTVDESLAPADPRTETAKSQSSSAKLATAKSGRGSHFDLGNFMVADCNRVAFNAAELISSQPMGTTGAMVFFGPIGSGKSHLLEGIAGRVRAAKLARVMTIKAADFGNQFKQAMAEYATASFRQRFSSVDVLCIDDIDFFESKRSFQDELLQTIERLEARGGTVLVTASVHPRMLTGLSDSLVSRLLSGPVCRIESPSQELRRAVAAARVKALELDITPDAVRYAADRFVGSVREVIGAVNTLHTQVAPFEGKVTLAAARKHLTSLERDAVQVVRISDIELAVAKLFGLQPTEMRSTRRSRTVSQPRQVAMYLSRKLTNGAYKEIGDHFGGRNHSTVMAAERNINKMLRAHSTMKIGFQDLPVSEIVARLEDQIRVG